MGAVVNANAVARSLTTTTAVDVVGISVVAFSGQQLDDALLTIRTTYGMQNNSHGAHQQRHHNTVKHGQQLVGGTRPPAPLKTGTRLFNHVPASNVLDYFIALLEHALNAGENSHGVAETQRMTFRDGLGVEHVLVQSFFIWLEHAEKCYRKGLPTVAAATTANSDSSGQVEQRRRGRDDDCDGFRPSQRTPSPPRKGGGRPKRQQHQHHRAAVGEEVQLQQQTKELIQQQQKQTTPAKCEQDKQQQALLEEMSDKLWKILRDTGNDDDKQELQQNHHQLQAVQGTVERRVVQEEQSKSNPTENHVHDGQHQNNNNNNNIASLSLPCLYRVLITQSHRDQIVSLLAPLCFPQRSRTNIWKTVVSALELKHVKHFAKFASLVKDLVQQGRVGFDLLSFCLQNFAEKMALNSHQLVHALLLGPLCATNVEQFVANRSEELRAQTRAALLEVESWKCDEHKWRAAAITYAHRSHEQLPDFRDFCSNITILLSELRNEMCDQDNLVDLRWAHSLIKTAARKLYMERTWKEEHFNDLVHTVLVQRPTLKAFVLNVLLKDHQDKRAHEKWRNFVSSERCRMSKNFDKVNMCTKDEQSHFLSLPRRCEVYVISSVFAFRIFERQFDQYFLKKQRRVVLGIDAEWNPYMARCRASLLQLALVRSVYLLDLDALHADKAFQQFIDRLFLDQSITKIGYQFGEDLAMLRARLPACVGLYRPQSIVCIGQLVDELTRRSVPHLPNFPLDTFLLPITNQQEEELKEHTRQIKLHRYDSVQNKNNNTSKSTASVVSNQPLLNGTSVDVQKPSSSNTIYYDPYDEEVDLFSGYDAQGRLRRTSKKKCKVSPAVPSGKSVADQGLAYLCRRVLGKSLDKQEQCSVWDRRPLRSRQIRYAALDAHCLMQIHHRCTEWSEQLGLGADPIALMPSSGSSQRYFAPLPLFCAFTVPEELLLTTTIPPADATGWGNELDVPEGWTQY